MIEIPNSKWGPLGDGKLLGRLVQISGVNALGETEP